MNIIIKSLLNEKAILLLNPVRKKIFLTKKEKFRIKIELNELKKRTEFYNTLINKHDLCFDVGANVGNRVAPLLEIGAKVIAVEPQKILLRYFKEEIREKNRNR